MTIFPSSLFVCPFALNNAKLRKEGPEKPDFHIVEVGGISRAKLEATFHDGRISEPPVSETSWVLGGCGAHASRLSWGCMRPVMVWGCYRLFDEIDEPVEWFMWGGLASGPVEWRM
jgi:hypothetical protein